MYVNVTGSGKKKQELVASMATYVGNKLMTKRLADNIKVNIKLINRLCDKESVFGDCIWEDDVNRPKEFTIRVDSQLPLRTMLETVAHEMVHVKQWAKGEMRQLMTQHKIRFKDKLYSNDVDYWDLPWEIEAHGREKGLFVRWAEDNGYGNQKWSQETIYN